MHAANTNSLYSDLGWKGPNDVMQAMTDKDLEWNLIGALYSQDGKSKTWKIQISFTDNRGKEKTLFGDITTYAAGTVQDPWSRYDMTTQVY